MTPSRRTIEAMTLGGMAIDNRSISVRCGPCRRTRVFLCADLAKVYGENKNPHGLFGRCSKCGNGVQVNFGFPQRGQVVRRPVMVWRDSVYEPPSRGDTNAS